MKPKFSRVLELAIEAGVASGWRRAHKHVDEPSEFDVCHAIEEAVMTEIYMWFDFEEDE